VKPERSERLRSFLKVEKELAADDRTLKIPSMANVQTEDTRKTPSISLPGLIIVFILGMVNPMLQM
jgi:hypothetical protein